MKSAVCVLGMAFAGMIAPIAAHAVTILVPDVDAGAENLQVTSLGAATASNVSFGNHLVGPVGQADTWERPIIQFPVSSFASLTGLSVVSATLHYSISSDFAEPGESATSEVCFFTTSETDLNIGNRDVFAGLSGAGGAHAVVGSVTFVDGMAGAQSLVFSPAALTALEAAINGSAPTLAISFREFMVSGGINRVDLLDAFVLGVPPGNVSIEVTAVPEPATIGLLLCGGVAALRSRHRRK